MTEQITDLIFDDLKRDVVERAKRNQTINSPSTLFHKKKTQNGGSDLMELARQVEDEVMEDEVMEEVVEDVMEDVMEDVVEEQVEEQIEEKIDPMEDSSDVVVIEGEEEEEESISYLEDADSVAENTAAATTVATTVEEEDDDDMYDFDDFSSTTASSSLPALPGMNNTNDGGSSDYDPMNDGNTIPNERGTVPAVVPAVAVPAVAHPPSSSPCCCCRCCCLYRFGFEARGGHFDRNQTVAPAWAGIPASTVPPHWSLSPHRQRRRRRASLCGFASPWKFDEQRGRGRRRKPNFDSGLRGIGKTKCCLPVHSWRKYVDRCC